MRLSAHGHFWVSLVGLAVSSLTLSSVAGAEALTADAAVGRAAQSNPTLRAALLDAAAARHGVAAEQGARDPTFLASLQGEHTQIQSQSRDPDFAGSAIRTSENSVTGTAAVRYTAPAGTQLELGTQIGTSLSSTRFDDDSPLISDIEVGPTYDASAYATVRQPLLRGAGRDAELAALDQAKAQSRAADSRAQVQASQTALDVLAAYWELWYADRATLVQEQALEVARRLVEDAKVRESTLGTGSRVDVLSFSTSAASIADALSQARAARTARAIELGRLLGISPALARAFEATGEPPELGPLASIDALASAARKTSPRSLALRADIERSSIALRSAEDADQPRVDLFATGRIGTLWDDDSGFSLSGGRPTYGILGGIELELPIGSGRYTADARRAKDERDAAEARYQAELDSIGAQVSSLGASLEAAGEQVALASEAAEAAQKLAEAERQRLLLGTTTAQNVVTAEQTRREAELRRLRALVSQVSMRFELEHTTGSLLTRFATSFAAKPAQRKS
jgi:outer membrane protein